MHGQVSSKNESLIDGRDPDAIDLRQLQDFFWRRWKLIGAVTIGAMALSLLALVTVTPRYTATAQVLLEPRKEKIFGSDNVLSELSLETGNVDSQIIVIQSNSLLRRVVEKEKLTEDAEFGKRAPNIWSLIAGLFGAPSQKDGTGKKGEDDIPLDVLNSLQHLRNALEVQRVNRTYVISISVTSETPAKAARLANAVADAYVVDQLDARYDAAKRASAWLAERMETLREQLRQSEEAVARFRKEHNLVATSSEAKVTISEQQLSELSGKLITARAETAEKRAKYEQATQISQRGGNLQTIPDVVRSNVISDLRKQQAEVARKEADLAARYSDQHPLVINARAERRDIERSINAEVQRILVNLKNDYDVAKSREDSLQQSLDQVTGQTGLNDSVGVRLRELERLNAANKTLFENFLSRAKVTQEQAAFEEREARAISRATLPSSPSFPKKGLVVALAAVVGALVGVGGAVALDMLNSGFLSAKEIEEKLRQPVLASLTIVPNKDRKIEGKVLELPKYIAAKPLSRYSESVRAVRVGIQMADVDHPAQVILVTSSVPGEGKTTMALSLAVSAAKTGQRVLLIDGDLRRPAASTYFSAATNNGLVDFLTGAASLEEAVIHKDGIAILPSGKKSQNPPDLLSSERMRVIIDKLRSVFDYIVIDSPPMGPVIDAKILNSLSDKTIFVVRWKATAREAVSPHVEFLALDHKLAGVVLNMVDESKAPRYGAYGQYGGYSSNYGRYYHN